LVMKEIALALEPPGVASIGSPPASTNGRTRRIIDAAGEAFVSIDADCRIVDWNLEAELVFGWPRSEAIGRPLAGTVLPPCADDDGFELGRFLSTGEGLDVDRRIEMLARHRDGYEFPVELTISPMPEGGQLTFAIFLRNITDRKQIERRLERAELESLRRLALAAEYRDEDTAEHTVRVGQLAALIAGELGLDRSTVRLIESAAPLHDVGKIAIPDAILYKPGGLTSEELDVVKRHTTVGAAILSGRDSPLLETAQQIAIAHHERWDGRGYPHRLARNAIPLPGRIVSVADAFDALTHRRPYKPAWSRTRALGQIRLDSGRRFDPRVVDAFLDVQLGVRPVDRATVAGPVGRARC
jgi:PAS domain S-box-containing protein/putative nucleotidyltransferase with HDIG domain